jgi:hypothetical protein
VASALHCGATGRGTICPGRGEARSQEVAPSKSRGATYYYYLLAPDRAVEVWLDFAEQHVYVALVKVSKGKPVKDTYRSPSAQKVRIGVLHFLRDILQMHDPWLEETTQAGDRWAKEPLLTLRTVDEMLTAEAEMVDRYYDLIMQQPEEVLFPMKWRRSQSQGSS